MHGWKVRLALHPPFFCTHSHLPLSGDEPFRTEDSNRFGPVSPGLSSFALSATQRTPSLIRATQVPLGLIESRLAWVLWPYARLGPLGRPLVPRHDAQRGSPDWRRSQAERERERWRASRVTIASPRPGS